MKEATLLTLLPASFSFPLGSGSFQCFPCFSPCPLFSPAATGRGLYDDPFAHKTNASQFRHVASPSTSINSRLSTLRRNTIFKSVPVENSEEYRVTAGCPSYAGLNLSGTGKMLSKQRPCFNLQIGAASFLWTAASHRHGNLFRFLKQNSNQDLWFR